MTKHTILVVEDEPIIRMIAVETFEEAGCEVVEFDNAEQAIAFCQVPDVEIAALFTDINLPGELDGLDVASVVAATHPKAVVIVTSGRYATKPADLSPRVTFLPKPWTAHSLVLALKSVVDQNGKDHGNG